MGAHDLPPFLAGGGELGRLIGAIDWQATPLGAIAGWPAELTVTVGTMLRSSAPITLLWGADGVLLYNAGYAAVAGARHPAILGQPVRTAWPEAADFNDGVLRDGLRGRSSNFRDMPFVLNRHGTPEQVWLNLDYSPVPDAQGRPLGVLAIVTETTGKVRAERQLGETQDWLRLAQEAGRIGTFELLPAAGVVNGSSQFARLFGLPDRGTFRVAEMLALVHPEDRAGMRTGQAQVTDDALDYTEYRVRRADTGEERWLARRGEGLTDAGTGVRRIVGVVYDITDRKRAEDRLRHLNDTLEQRVAMRTTERDRMWRLSSDVMVVADYQGRVHAVNPAWSEMLGWAAEDLLGTDLLDLIHPDDAGPAAQGSLTIPAGQQALQYQNRYRHKDGSYRWLSWAAVPDMGFVHAVGRDVTAQMETQAALSRTEEALRQSQKMEAVGQLTGGIAHDFNNLLTVVMGNIELAGRMLDRAENTPPRARAVLDNAMEGAGRAAALTQRLLAFSRRQPLAPRALSVDRLVAGMSDLLTRALGETIRVETHAADGLWQVEADPNQLENALLNLAVNARDAMPGGGRLRIEMSNVPADDPLARAADLPSTEQVRIAVIDTGEGMSDETMARVFEPFFTTKDVGKGTGLGLSMVYGFVRQSGGQVKLRSKPGEGTTVSIFLPRFAGDAAAALPENAGRTEIGGGAAGEETILAVEDDADVRAYTVACLRELGYRVIEAADGAAALRALRAANGRVDLLFSDVVMPGMSGGELAERARTVQPGLKLLYTSGYPRDVLGREGRLDAGVEVLAKPFTLAALADKVRAAIDEAR